LDPQGAAGLAAEAGRQRIARMIEIVLLTGRPRHCWQRQQPDERPGIEVFSVVLEVERAVLYERINQRVHQMLAAGLVAEVQALLERGFGEYAPGMKTTGYSELIPYLRGECSLAAAVDAIQRATRRYARRQITWFRHQLAEPVLRLDANRPQEQIVQDIVQEWRRHHENRN
jgi:tRNA dimethylallyltransferase